MNNPFAIIEAKLGNIENLLLSIKHQPVINNLLKVPQDLLTIQQASELLSLSVATIYSKVSRGELPVMKRGKRLYFSREELILYIKEGKKKSSAELDAEANAYLSNKKSAAL